MKTKSTSRLAFPLASAIASLFAAPPVHAGQIWDGTGADNNWNTAGNWDGDLLPTFTNAITFVGNVRNGAVNNLTADSIIGGINLTNDWTAGKTNAFTLSGNRITLGGNITTTASSSAITDIISLAMILNADRTITTNTNHDLTVSGIISQSGGARRLTKDGAGILTLSNANTYSGGTTINNGTLNVANVSGLGATGSTVSLSAASTLRLSTDTAFGGANPLYNVQMQGGGSYTGTIELNRATAGAYTGITHNFGQLTISLNGGGAATLNVTAGANAAGALDTIAFTGMSAGNNNTVTETLNPTGGNIAIGTLTAFGNQLVTIALSGTTAGNTITGVIGGTGNQQLVAISKIGNSTWTLSNSGNNYTGGTTFSAGTLVFASGALGTTGAITGSGGTLRWASGNTQDISSRLAMTAATSTFDTNGNNVTFASAIGSSVAAALTKTGSGALTLQGTNTYTGSTTVNAGTLTLDYGTNNTTKLSDTTALVLGGGTLNLAGGSHTEIVSATTLTAATGSYVTRSSGSSVLQTNTIANSTGTVNFGAENIATTDNLNSGTTGIIGTWATVGGDWAINSGSTTSGGATVPGVGVADGFIRAYTAYTDLTRQSSGTKAIPNTPTANVRIVEGTGGSPANITLAAATTSINTLNQSISGGTGAATVALAGQILRTDGILMGATAGALTIGASPSSGTLSSSAATGSVMVTNNSANTLTINSVIANNTTTGLVKNGPGVLLLTGLNTYTGGTTLQDGTIRVGATQNAGFNGILGPQFVTGLTIANKSTAVFDLNNFDAYIKDLIGGGSLGGNVTLGSGTLFLVNPSNQTYSGVISGTGNLHVGDTSAWTTTGAHTYSGITTVKGGVYIATILADGGLASGIGQSTSAAGNLVINNGNLTYNGTSAASTNRQFTLQGNGGFGVESSGTITWSSTAAVIYSGAGTKTLNFSRNGTGLGTLAASIGDNSGSAISINKTGSSNWNLTNTGSAFTGAITFNAATGNSGTLSYASAGGGNAITFSQTTGSATLSYIGATDKTMSGLIQANALTAAGVITLDSSGAGAVNYSNTGSLGVGGASGAKGLVLSGTNTGTNTLAGGWSNNTLGGAATLTKNGAGTWILTNTNGYTGATTVNLGTLRAGAAAGGQAFGSGSAVTLANAVNTFLDLNGFNQTIGSLAGGGANGGNVTLGANAILTTGGNNTSTSYAGVISGTGTSGLTKTGSGTLTLTNANSYSGGTTISVGSLQANNSSALGSGSVSVAAGAALLVGVNGITLANNITLNGTTTNGAINNGHPSAGNTTNLTGTITLNATSNITTNWNDKTLQLSGKITGVGGLNFDLRSGSVGGRFLITGTTNDYAGATSVTGTATPAFGFTGQAMLYLGANNALPTTTALTLNYADLYLNGRSQTLPSISGSGSFSVQNGSTTAATLTLGSGDTTSTFSGSIKDNGLSVTNTASTSPTPPASIVGTVALTKIGNGELILNNSSTNYTGATSLSAGTLTLASTTAFASPITMTAGSTLQFKPTAVSNIGSSAMTIALNGTLNYSPASLYQIINGGITVGSTSIINITPTATGSNFVGLYMDTNGLNGSAALTVNGSTSFGGTALILRATNSNYSGAMTVNGTASATSTIGTGLALGPVGTSLSSADLTINGTLELGNNGGAAGGMTAATNAVTGTSVSIDALNGSGVVASNGITRTLSVGNNNETSATFSGTLANGTAGSSVLNLTKAGTGTQTLSGNNTYTGTTTVSGGTLQLGNGGTTGSLTGTSDITNNANLTINRSTPFTQATELNNKAITGSGSFTQAGAGTTTLSLTNTYAGATNVNAGKLLIDGSTSSTSLVTVASGATLGGSGAIGGGVTVQGGGTFAPGNSIDSIATGNLALLASAVFAQEIDKSVLPGISGDLTATTGSLSITSGAILTLNELGASGVWQDGDKITLIGYSTGTWNGGLFTYLGNTLNNDSTFTFSGIDWTFNYNDLTAGDNYNSDLSAFTGSARYVTMTAIPEPRTALLGGVGMLLLLLRRRS